MKVVTAAFGFILFSFSSLLQRDQTPAVRSHSLVRRIGGYSIPSIDLLATLGSPSAEAIPRRRSLMSSMVGKVVSSCWYKSACGGVSATSGDRQDLPPKRYWGVKLTIHGRLHGLRYCDWLLRRTKGIHWGGGSHIKAFDYIVQVQSNARG